MKTTSTQTKVTIMKLVALGWGKVDGKPYMLKPPVRILVPPELHVSDAAVLQQITNPGSLSGLLIDHTPGPDFHPLRLVKRRKGTTVSDRGKRSVGAKFGFPSPEFKTALTYAVARDYEVLGTWPAVSRERDNLNTGVLWRVGKKGDYSPTAASVYVEQGILDWDGY